MEFRGTETDLLKIFLLISEDYSLFRAYIILLSSINLLIVLIVLGPISKINSFLNKAESRLKANDLNSSDGSIKNALEGAILSSQLAEKSNVSYEVQDKSTVKLEIPSWVKNNAKWWSTDATTTNEFLKSLEFLINQRILVIPDTIQGQSESTGSGVPAWVKNNASWWANDVIGDSDFVLAIQYLISQRIIQVDSSKVNVSTTIIEEESTDTSLRLEPKNITKPEIRGFLNFIF